MKHYSPTGRRNHGRTLSETSGYVRPERVNKWPISVTDVMMMIMMMRSVSKFESFLPFSRVSRDSSIITTQCELKVTEGKREAKKAFLSNPLNFILRLDD